MENLKATDPVYSVNQLAMACGTSRSGILRLEEEGLLTPAVHAEPGSKRMYTFLDMMKLRQIVMLHNYGFTHATIKDYFEDNGNYINLISLLSARQSDIFYFIKEMELRMAEDTGLEIEYVYSPAVPCHTLTKVHRFPYYDVLETLIVEQMKDIISKKYELSTTRPLFLTTPWEDLANGASINDEREFTGYVPLTDVPLEPDPSVKVSPRQRVLSVLARGPEIPMEEIIEKFKDEISGHNLEVTGPLFIISMVGPQLGLDIPEERYLSRIMLPIR